MTINWKKWKKSKDQPKILIRSGTSKNGTRYHFQYKKGKTGKIKRM